MRFRHVVKFALVTSLLSLTLAQNARAGANQCADLFAIKQTNPLIGHSGLSYNAVPFDRIKLSDFYGALDEAFVTYRQKAEAIGLNPNPATFENTVEVLGNLQEPIDRLSLIYHLHASTKADPDLDKIGEYIDQKFAKSIIDNDANRRIIERLNTLFRDRKTLNLTPEQNRLLVNLRNQYTHFNNGAVPSFKINAVNEKLDALTKTFQANLLKAESAIRIEANDPAEIEGIPGDVVASAKERAEKEKSGAQWSFVLADVRTILLATAKSRAFRERAWRARSRLGTEQGSDNRPVLLEIAKLRAEYAKLHGAENYAARILPARMARSVETVNKFLSELAATYVPAAQKEIAELEKFAGHPIEAWDVDYYTGLLQEKKFGFDDQDLRAYFPFERVLQGYFYTAGRLYGVKFKPRPDLPVWDPSVRAYEVTDREGRHLALYYIDPFRRLGEKRSGAWNTHIQQAGIIDGKRRRSFVVNVENFIPPAPGQPALLTPDNVVTLFHEGGHALHEILTEASYRQYAGTAVQRDFVEFPSQFMENYAFQPDVLNIYAQHYKTKEKLPPSMAEKIRAQQTFMSAVSGVTQVRQAMLDMAWYTQDLSTVNTVDEIEAFEAKVFSGMRFVPDQNDFMSSSFQHIFTGGYAAGYYGYKWGEAIAADAFEAFEEAGLFDPATAHKFREHILAKGGTEQPGVLYRRFRGRDADPQAVLRLKGLAPPKAKPSAAKPAA